MSRPLKNQWYEPQSKLLPLICSKLKGNQTQAFLSAHLSGVAESEDGSGREGGLNISVPSISYLQRKNIILKKNIDGYREGDVKSSLKT